MKAKTPLCRSHQPWCLASVAMSVLLGCQLSVAADMTDAKSLYFAGKYDECIEMTRAEMERGVWNDFWSQQLMRSLVATGQYSEACQVYEQVSSRFRYSLPLRILAATAYRFSGDAARGDRLLDEIPELVQSEPWRFSDRDNTIALGRYLLSVNEDARAVLSNFYDRALRSDSKFVDAHIAIAELALEKADFQEAVKSLARAAQLNPEDPQIDYLLARAWQPSDGQKAVGFLNVALEKNPRHVESLLLQVEKLIHAEQYEEAEQALELVLEINESEPVAWAYRAAIAHLRGNYADEGKHRKQALLTWQSNPQVDHLIGKLLSQHYRFAEGVKYQRRSLRLSPNFMPAKFQLAQDLLRVGLDDEGWTIVDQVSATDKYNVVAYNLKTLQEQLSAFSTIEVPGFVIRMDAREARIYGPRVVSLLQEAKEVLTAKYEYELTQPVTVEIFPQQSDFAIRTFGLPGGAGFLGVCFGSLITANSPASQGESPSNWESVLWHEFCHVVTLQKTNNRMPRWLSEGISVYEELQRDPAWGQSMTPVYRDMLLGDDFVPLSELSGAFLNPKNPMALQFAYFESSLAVRFLIETSGMPLLQKFLVDLGAGVPPREAFENRYGAAAVWDEMFAAYASDLAKSFLPETDFDREGVPTLASVEQLKQWLSEHPNSYFGRRALIDKLIRSERWDEARSAAQELKKLYPTDGSPAGSLEMLAAVARQAGDGDLERQTLQEIIDVSSDCITSLIRLSALAREDENWPLLAKVSGRLLAVQPLIATGHEGQADSAERLQQPAIAIDALRALQEMEPLDPANLHYRLARSLYEESRMDEARRQALLALEHSPRFRESQKLLAEIYHRLHPKKQLDVELAIPDAGQPPRPAATRR